MVNSWRRERDTRRENELIRRGMLPHKKKGEDAHLDEYFSADAPIDEPSNEEGDFNFTGYYKLSSHKRAARVKSMFPNDVEIQGQYIFISRHSKEAEIQSYMDSKKIPYKTVKSTGIGNRDELSARERATQAPLKFNEDDELYATVYEPD